jgi:hypothetical protein
MRFAIVAAGALAASAVVLAANTARADGSMDDKKITVGGDLQFIIPVGDMSNGTGPQIGPLVRAGYRVIPPLEITARLGYLWGFNKSTSAGGITVNNNVSNFPIWVGARYFFMDAPAGLYGAAELALNIMSDNFSQTGNVAGNNLGTSGSTGATREGFNLGVGYVISPDLPIDIRAQFSYFNLLGTNSGENALFGIGLSAGYSFFF